MHLSTQCCTGAHRITLSCTCALRGRLRKQALHATAEDTLRDVISDLWGVSWDSGLPSLAELKKIEKAKLLGTLAPFPKSLRLRGTVNLAGSWQRSGTEWWILRAARGINEPNAFFQEGGSGGGVGGRQPLPPKEMREADDRTNGLENRPWIDE